MITAQRTTARATDGRPVPIPPGLSVLVLGGTGFLGRHICSAFGAVGATVARVARGASTGAPDGLFTRLDLVDAPAERIADILLATRADVVVNSVGAVWGMSEDQMYEGNTELVRRLVAAIAAVPHEPRLVHLGSLHEYGPVPRGTRISEDVTPAPDTPYGRSKLLGARAVLDAAAEGTLHGTVLRIANVAGPGTPPDSLLGILARRLHERARTAASGELPAELRLAPLTAWRDFIDVRDVADAVVAASVADVCGQVVNIGSGEAVEVRELVRRLIDLSGLTLSVVEDQNRDEQRGDLQWQRCDISRARHLLGWRPRLTLEHSLRDLLLETGVGVLTRSGGA
ncbi:NAD-dependent epimerase/dehydratase family protein [Streptomyces sp. NPDC020917]|uniref:NAD-dependent epimerase/dehydratase family protein n=1 Tax=Streptomyces sp. NPDC020917 TaxID=3365102 RepID=UPI0037B6B2F6